jgi:DNA end-binding protein Ku
VKYAPIFLAILLRVDRMTGKFEPEKFEDRYENAMIELIRSKQTGQPVKQTKAATKASNVVNLMNALKRSIDAGDAKMPAKKPEAASATPRKRAKKAG